MVGRAINFSSVVCQKYFDCALSQPQFFKKNIFLGGNNSKFIYLFIEIGRIYITAFLAAARGSIGHVVSVCGHFSYYGRPIFVSLSALFFPDR